MYNGKIQSIFVMFFFCVSRRLDVDGLKFLMLSLAKLCEGAIYQAAAAIIKSSVLFERDALQNIHARTADYVRLLIKKFTNSLTNSDNLQDTFCVLKIEICNEECTRCNFYRKKKRIKMRI